VPNQILTELGTQIRFCVAGSFSPADAGTNWTEGTPTDVLLTLSGVANGAGRQSSKVDLGANFADGFRVLGCVDYTGETPTQGSSVDYYWLPSTSATAGNGNVAGNSGVDGAAPDGALGSLTLADFIELADFIGSLYVHDGASVQNGSVSPRFYPSSRYGQLLVVNNGGDVFEADDVEAHQVFVPIIPEVQ
jgi:hypothetical protein